MTAFRRRLLLASLLAMPAAARAQPGLPAGHPVEDYQRAAALFGAGEQNEATYWFYRGQLRARIHLAARSDLPPDGDPALFASLNETIGRPINEWAFGDVPGAVATIRRVLAWHAANDDPFTPKAEFPAAHLRISGGLDDLAARMLADQDRIGEQRRANGLPNRS